MERSENPEDLRRSPVSPRRRNVSGLSYENAITALVRAVEKLADRIGEMNSSPPTAEWRIAESGDIQVGNLRLNPRSRHVSVSGNPIQLSAGEFRILHRLVVDRPEVVKFSDLYDAYSGPGAAGHQNLKVYVNRLRSKLRGTTAKWDGQIINVRSVGYRFIGPPGP